MKIGFLKRVGLSCGSFNKYYDMVKSGDTVKYFFLFTLLLGLIVGGISGGLMFASSRDAIRSVFEDCPDFILSDGVLKAEGDMPLTYYDNSGDTFIIVDTRESPDKSYLRSDKNILLISRDSITEYNKNRAPKTLLRFSTIRAVTITQNELFAFRNGLGNFVPFALLLGFIIGKLIAVPVSMIFSALLLSLLALLINHLIRLKMKYSDALATTIYAITLPSILYEGFLTFTGNAERFLFYGVSVVFLFMALFTMKRASRMKREAEEVFPENNNV